MRPTNFERVMTVVNATKGKRVATVDIARAIAVPVAKVRLWLLEWASKGMICVNKDGVVSRKKGTSGTKRKTRAKKWPDVQLDLPFEVVGHPDCPRNKIYIFSKEPTLTPLLGTAATAVYVDDEYVTKEDENV